jgi:Tfp pilus assembly PilM family ATPase
MSILSFLHESAAPSAAVELASARVSAALLELRAGRPVVAAHAVEPLPPGALVPSLTAANIHDRSAVVGALERAFDRIGGRPRRVGLIVPDLIAKVSFVRFERVPAKKTDLDQLVRWQVKKAAPFAIEDAQVSYSPGQRASDGQEFVVSVARRSVVEEYEGLCAGAGIHPGIVDLATFNVVNAILAGGHRHIADWLLVNVTTDYASIAIVRGEHLIFFRNRATEGEGSLADLVHQSAMYYEDRLSGGGFDRVFLAGHSGGSPAEDADLVQAKRSLEERLGIVVESVDPRSAADLTDRITAAPALLDALAPLVGLLLRGQDAAVTQS